MQRFGDGGERERYFADDDRADLTTLVKRQKHAGAFCSRRRDRPVYLVYLCI